MALPTVTALIHQVMAEKFPGTTIAQLERRSRKKKNYLQQWCDPSTTVELPPQHETIYALARMLEVSSGDVYLAFLKDSTGIDDESAEWQTGLASDEQELLDLYHQTPDGQRHIVRAVLRLFASGFQPSPFGSTTDEATTNLDDQLTPAQGISTGSPRATPHHPTGVAL